MDSPNCGISVSSIAVSCFLGDQLKPRRGDHKPRTARVLSIAAERSNLPPVVRLRRSRSERRCLSCRESSRQYDNSPSPRRTGRTPMIDLYFWPTGNGKKIVILLEELGLPYTFKPINIGRGDQLTPAFLKISPNGRMPAIVDDEPMGGGEPISIFESGAIMTYLAEKDRKIPAHRSARQIRRPAVGQLANGQSGSQAGRARPFPARARQRQEWRPHLRPAPLRQRGASDLRRHEPRPVQQALSRRRRIHHRRHDLLSLGLQLGHAGHRHRGIPQREALAGRNRRAAGRQESDGPGTGVPRRPGLDQRRRAGPPRRNWWRTSGRSQFRRNG